MVVSWANDTENTEYRTFIDEGRIVEITGIFRAVMAIWVVATVLAWVVLPWILREIILSRCRDANCRAFRVLSYYVAYGRLAYVSELWVLVDYLYGNSRGRDLTSRWTIRKFLRKSGRGFIACSNMYHERHVRARLWELARSWCILCICSFVFICLRNSRKFAWQFSQILI